MEILDGKKVSNQIKEEITVEVEQMKERGEKVPHLAAVLVGNDGASLTYVGSKVRSCKKIGFESTLNASRKKRIATGSGTSIQEVNQLLKQFNQMSKMMKMMQGGGGKKMMQMMQNMR